MGISVSTIHTPDTGGPVLEEPKQLVTQMDFARVGQITDVMRTVAEREHRDPEFIRAGVAAGRIAIPANIRHLERGLGRDVELRARSGHGARPLRGLARLYGGYVHHVRQDVRGPHRQQGV